MIRLAQTDDLEALGRLGAELMRTHHAFDAQRSLAPNSDRVLAAPSRTRPITLRNSSS